MRLAKDDQLALAVTISSTGFAESLRDLICIAFSKPDVEGNKAVHAKANEQLLEVLLEDHPGHCIHITGEMRALADPFHRRLCAELVKRANTRFTIVYNIPDDYQHSPDGVGTWNAETWKSKSWTDKLSAINFIGDAFVDVRAYDTLQEIQYSVFGDRYVLLQEKHSDEGGGRIPLAKRVWLLKSEKLNEFLTARAMAMVGKSKDIPEVLFKRFSAKLSGMVAQTILRKLAKSGGSAPSEQVIDEPMRAFDPDAESDLEALRSIGFIRCDNPATLSLTSEGVQYLEALE